MMSLRRFVEILFFGKKRVHSELSAPNFRNFKKYGNISRVSQQRKEEPCLEKNLEH
jgi:hypothetical protein